MIYKPTSPVPFNTVLKGDKTFSFNVGNPKLVTDFRVSLIDVDGNTYNYPVTSKTGDTSSCSWQYSEDNYYDYAFVQNGDTYERQENQKYAIKDNMGYSWRTRLYSGTPTTTTDNDVATTSYDNVKPNSNIGYGTIHEIINLSTSLTNADYGALIGGGNTDADHSIIRLKINAHTNMCMDANDIKYNYFNPNNKLYSTTYYKYQQSPELLTIIDGTTISSNTLTTFYPNISGFDSSQLYISIPIDTQLTQNFDDKVVYYIQIKGINYRIRAYYYSYMGDATYNPGHGSATHTTVSAASLQLDSYNTPLYAYIEIEVENTDGLICNSQGGAWESGQKYTNIDKLPFSENDEYSIWANYIDSDEYAFLYKQAPTITFVDSGSGTETEVHFDGEYAIGRSNINLKGTYSQPSGSMINYYRVMLYNEDKSTMLDDTGMIYDTEVNYEYHLFFPDTKYKLEIQIVDSDNVSTVKTLTIDCNYSLSPLPFDIATELNTSHGSVIVDFDSVISITGATENNRLSYNTETTIDEKDVATCSIAENNSITFSKYDNQKPLVVNDFLLTMIVKIDSEIDNNTLFEYTDDNGYIYALRWNGLSFVYSMSRSSVVVSNSKVAFTNTNTADIETGLADTNLNYNYPYVADTAITFDTTDTTDTIYYYHIEDKLQDFYWQVIATPDKARIICLNPPTEADDYNENDWDITVPLIPEPQPTNETDEEAGETNG